MSRKEMKSIMAGSGTSVFVCQCSSIGSPGDVLAFSAEVSSTVDLIAQIEANCGNRGGGCSAL